MKVWKREKRKELSPTYETPDGVVRDFDLFREDLRHVRNDLEGIQIRKTKILHIIFFPYYNISIITKENNPQRHKSLMINVIIVFKT